MNNTLSLKKNLTILFALILAALGIYFAMFHLPETTERDLMSEFKSAPTISPDNQGSTAGLASVDTLLVGLKQRLESQPDDVDGWVLLSKSYFHLDRWEQADEAFEKAKALGYAGSWQPLPRIDAFSESSSSLQDAGSSINFRDYRLSAAQGQSTIQPGDTSAPTGSATSKSLKLKVSLNPALQNELSPEAPVFVFVRAAENPGPPLAVVRKKVAELPFEIALNDSHAMIPGKTISSSENVIVGARISISGNPERQAGDFEKLSNSIPSTSDKTLELVIKDKI